MSSGVPSGWTGRLSRSWLWTSSGICCRFRSVRIVPCQVVDPDAIRAGLRGEALRQDLDAGLRGRVGHRRLWSGALVPSDDIMTIGAPTTRTSIPGEERPQGEERGRQVRVLIEARQSSGSDCSNGPGLDGTAARAGDHDVDGAERARSTPASRRSRREVCQVGSDADRARATIAIRSATASIAPGRDRAPPRRHPLARKVGGDGLADAPRAPVTSATCPSCSCRSSLPAGGGVRRPSPTLSASRPRTCSNRWPGPRSTEPRRKRGRRRWWRRGAERTRLALGGERDLVRTTVQRVAARGRPAHRRPSCRGGG